MPELWNQEECYSFSEMSWHGEGDPTGVWGDMVKSKYVIQVRSTGTCGRKGH